MGIAMALVFIAFFWFATHFQAEGATPQGIEPGSPWAPWCASTGGGEGRKRADTSAYPSQPLTIETLEAYRAQIVRFLEAMGVDENEVDDLTQEIVIGAWKNRATYDPARAKLSTWLYGIAKNIATTARDRAYARRTVLYDPAVGPWIRQVTESDPEAETAGSEARQHAVRLLSGLAPELSSVLVDHDLLGMLPAEMAREEGVSLRRIQNRITIARTEFGQALRREEAREQHREAVNERRRGQGKR